MQAARFTNNVGTSAKWAAAVFFAAGVIAFVVSTQDDSCVETPYGGSSIVKCESIEFFLPGSDDDVGSRAESSTDGILSIPWPPRLIALFAALRRGGCETTELAEGRWTVCNDGFSLLEREKPVVAIALRLKADGDPVAVAERNRAKALDGVKLPVKDSDCGQFLCSTHLENEHDPMRKEYMLSLTDRERVRLEARVRAWKSQEIMRDLEEARAANTALHARLAEIAAYEADLARAEAEERREQKRAETVAQLQTDALRPVDGSRNSLDPR